MHRLLPICRRTCLGLLALAAGCGRPAADGRAMFREDPPHVVTVHGLLAQADVAAVVCFTSAGPPRDAARDEARFRLLRVLKGNWRPEFERMRFPGGADESPIVVMHGDFRYVRDPSADGTEWSAYRGWLAYTGEQCAEQGWVRLTPGPSGLWEGTRDTFLEWKNVYRDDVEHLVRHIDGRE